jgi:probable HAF family extracellular repeat protein
MRRQIYLLAFSIALGTASNAFGQNPTFTQIDYPGATSTQSWGINSRGDIVGYYVNADKSTHGFLLSGGHFTSIDFPGAAVTLVNGINSRGDIVGEFGVTLTSSHRGFQLSIKGVFTPIDYPGATYTSGIGITPGGDILGIYNFADNVSHGFILSEDRYTSFDFPGSTGTVPNGIDAQGDIVGGYAIGSVSHGFRLSNGNFTSFDVPDAVFTTATGANASGNIVGRYRDAAGVNHGFLMNGNQFTTIDYPDASFTGSTSIDPAGNIVGRCTVGGLTHGFLMSTPRPATRYSISDLGVVGGPPGQPYVMTNNGLLSGAAVADDGSMHAVLWNKGHKSDLGSPGLGGLNSLGLGVNQKGQVVGAAESSTMDVNGEDFCTFSGNGLPSRGSRCLPFIWQSGVMTPLPTLGGANGEGSWINNRGEIVGTAETTTRDPGCQSPQQFQFKPVIWERGQVQELPTAGSDQNGYAFAINDLGQAVGASGDCSALQASGTYLQARHALLWQTGGVTDLGNLGGTGTGVGILALGINNLGQAVGVSDLAGDETFHAFLWSERTGMQDLGTLPGDVASVGLAINDAGEVTGISFDADFNSRTFVWRNGAMTDLNTLVPADSPLFLVLACSLNASGEIAGIGVDDNGETHGFMATPVGGAAPLLELGKRKVLSEEARKMVRERLHSGRATAGAPGHR